METQASEPSKDEINNLLETPLLAPSQKLKRLS